MLLFVLMHLVASVLAENAGLSRKALKFMIYMLLLYAGSVSFLDSPRKVVVVLKLYLLSFAWYGLQGLPRGVVAWHPLLANEDSYGPLMGISLAFSFFFAMAVRSRGWRLFAWAMVPLSALGVVVSFARGAALAAGAVLLHIVARSPRRVAAVASLALGAIVLLPVAALMLPLDTYLEELGTISEGKGAGTGKTRWVLWRLALGVFQESPLYGVGANNFGVVASRMFEPEDLEQTWHSAEQLYLVALHNPHVQILAEEGLVGFGLWIAMIVGFFKQTRRLQRDQAVARWTEQGGQAVDLRLAARGLEAAMIGFLANSIFYNQLYIHWFWSLLSISSVMTVLAASSSTAASETRPSHRPLP
jgi:O-antigen ligase